MKKKFVWCIVSFIFIAILSTGIFAAGQKEEKKKTGKLRVALLLPGPITDQGWNQLAYNALKAVEKEFNAEIAYTERTPASDYEEIFRGYAVAGYDVIMGHGFEFGDAAKKVGKEFPKQIFIVTSTNIFQAPNVASFRINDPQSGFVQGYIAALLTKTNKIGTIGGMEIPPVINQQKGFEAGAKYYNPNIEVVSALIGNFEDVAKAKEMAKAMYQAGADIIVADADEASLGIVEAARETGNKVIGS
ncbi:MAG: BMP family protein, partial [Spirochaetota bacterium]